MTNDLTLDELKQTQRALDYFLANFDLTTSEKRAANRAYDKLDAFIDEQQLNYGIDHVTDADTAQQVAIDWQNWASNQSLSYGELASWTSKLEAIATKFNLTDEFKENGII
jgi:transcription initiation factor TFIIIB Brf1 subunit/transcription initiation factor TFIIB